ncbi:pirin family protein, partial [Candidatus Uhrbacteria bacterium]|nr:pirin family protein [Candidatus Uhrbacteria bacterium]
GGAGFDDHFHDNMEIVTIPLTGTLEHRDSLGNTGQITPGEIQHMSAGYGILHAEYNPSPTEAVSLLQIWVLPKEMAIKPRYAQKRFDLDAKPNQFVTVVAPDGQTGEALSMNQEAAFHLGRFSQPTSVELKPLGQNHGFYVFVIEGGLEVGGETLEKRDAAGISETESLKLEIRPGSFILVMDIPMLS